MRLKDQRNVAKLKLNGRLEKEKQEKIRDEGLVQCWPAFTKTTDKGSNRGRVGSLVIEKTASLYGRINQSRERERSNDSEKGTR